MGKNNQQRQAEARAKAKPQPTTETPAAQPKQEAALAPAAPAPAAQATKQEQTISKLREAWTQKGVDLTNLAIKDDGKFKLLIVADNWPTISIGPTGGISVLELRSYAKAFDAAIDGLALYQKQQSRDAKKTAAPAQPAPAPAAPAQAAKESTTQRRKKQDAAIEEKLQTA